MSLTESTCKALLAKISLAVKPLPRPKLLTQSADRAKNKWGWGYGLPENVLPDLWVKLNDPDKWTTLQPFEIKHIPRVLLHPVGPDMPALFPNQTIRRHSLSLIEGTTNNRVKQLLIKAFFSRFPLEDPIAFKDISESAQRMATILGSHEATMLRLGFLSHCAHSSVCAQLLDTETVSEGLARLLGWYAPGDAGNLSHHIWQVRLSVYTEMVMKSMDDSIGPTVEFVQRDSSDTSGRFRFPQNFSQFCDALFRPFLPARIPSRDTCRTLIRLIKHFIGPPSNAPTSAWQQIPRPVRNLLDLWAVWEQFDDAFTLVSKVLERNCDSNAIRHWTDRRNFWERYLRAGRIRRCRLYSPAVRLREFRYRYGQRFPEIFQSIGTLLNRYQTSFMLIMQLDDGLLISEIESNGKLHIGLDQKYVSIDKGSVDWDTVRQSSLAQITHNSNWHRTADDKIRYLTGLAAP